MNTLNDTQTEPESNQDERTEQLLFFFKALADAKRLKIIGLLAQQELSVEQMAEMLDLNSSTVSRHLSFLAHAGLVSARAEGYYSIYRLETRTLDEMARRLLAHETLPQAAAGVDLDAYDRKVMASFVDAEGRIIAVPKQEKKYLVLLRHVIQAFTPEVRYTEKQVNQILARFHKDTARLRRSLVEYHFMAREGGGGKYWRLERDHQSSSERVKR